MYNVHDEFSLTGLKLCKGSRGYHCNRVVKVKGFCVKVF